MTLILEEQRVFDWLVTSQLGLAFEHFGTSESRTISYQFYPDDAIAPRCVRRTHNSYHIYFPLGAYNRLFLFCTMVVSPALDHLGLVQFKLSPTDKRDVTNFIPRRLRNVFDAEYQFDVAEVMSLLSDFPVSEEDMGYVATAISHSFMFLFFHEFVHIDSGHFEFIAEVHRKPEAWDSKLTIGMALADVLEGLEVAADQASARYLARFIEGLVDFEREREGEGADIKGVMLPVGIGLACVISLFDWKSRSFDAVVSSHYPHPLIRWGIIQNVIGEELGGNSALAEAWMRYSEEAVRLVNGRIGAASLSEMAKDSENAGELKEPFHPVAQLQRDENIFGQSVMFEYMIRSVERGRRAENLIAQFNSELIKLLPGFSNAESHWKMQLERFRQIEELRRQQVSDPSKNPFARAT